MPWGYFELDPCYQGPDWRAGLEATAPRYINLNRTYVLVGCEPHTMFRPGCEPQGFGWFWWDNSMLPHLRYPSSANPDANKLWSRLTYRGWNMPKGTAVDHAQRDRVNVLLQEFSKGRIKDIAELWGGARDQQPLARRHCLVIRSSDRNYREYYHETWEQYWERVRPVLERWGYTWEVRSKVSVRSRIGNQITDQIREGGFDCVLANHSAGASEAAVTGTAVITTSGWNPAREVSTPWEHFERTGEVLHRTAEEIDAWVTRLCAYTYHRTELNTLRWIDHHPDAGYLKEQRYAIHKGI